MDPHQCFIGIDIGTQGAKAVLYHARSQVIVARAASSYDIDDNNDDNDDHDGDISSSSGRAEQHPIKWIHALHILLKTLSKTIHEKNYIIGGIGVSGQQHGMVALDEKYNVIRSAKLWCDVEAAGEATDFSKQAKERMNNTPWSVPPGFTCPKVIWMKHNEPKNFEKMKWIILPHDYINLCLRTGIGYDCDGVETCIESVENHKVDFDQEKIVPTTDAGDASGTGVLLPETRDYVTDLTQIVDEKYMDSLPKILKPSDICGTLSTLWKKAVNIDPNNSKPIPISVGSGDNMMSALGCQCVSPGNAVLSLGTSGTIFGVSITPPQNGTPVAPFCDATGKYLPLVCVMSCTGVLNSVLENWCSTSASNQMTHEEATKKADSIPPGCHGLTFLPYLGGERTPDWPHASGALLGLTPQNMNCMSGGSPGLVYRAAMEGVTYLLAVALDQMRISCGDGFDPKSLFVVGGGSKNPLWRQMLADVLQMELRFPLEPESAALGAAFQAGAAATGTTVEQYVNDQKVVMEDTILKPTNDEKVLKLYQDALQRYKTMSTKLFE